MSDIPSLFDPIADGYERMSGVLSLWGIRAWHAAAVQSLRLEPGMSVLDVGAGTGDVTMAMARRVGPRGRVVGLDPSAGMLDIARHRAQDGSASPEWVLGVGEALPFASASFDRVTAHFSLRNMHDWRMGLAEMTRVCRPDGRVVLLDLLQPATTRGALSMRGLDLATRAAGRLGFSSYRWLERSLVHAPSASDVANVLRRLGYRVEKQQGWLGDLVTLMTAVPLDGHAARSVTHDAPRVLWAVDGSLASETAGLWLRRHLGTHHVVDVVTVCPPYRGDGDQDVAATDRRAWASALERAAALLRPSYVVETHLLEGMPGPTLLEFARETEPAMIVMGLRHRQSGADRLLGSVASYIVAQGDWPVTAVPPGKPASGTSDRDGPLDQGHRGR